MARKPIPLKGIAMRVIFSRLFLAGLFVAVSYAASARIYEDEVHWSDPLDPDAVTWEPYKTHCAVNEPTPLGVSRFNPDYYPTEDVPNCMALNQDALREIDEADWAQYGCVITSMTSVASIIFESNPGVISYMANPGFYVWPFIENYQHTEEIWCPDGYSPTVTIANGTKHFVQEPIGFDEINSGKNRGAPECGLSAGNPINLATGNKFQAESDLELPGALKIKRYYNSDSDESGALGVAWRHSYSRHIELRSSVDLSRASIVRVADDGKANYWRLRDGVVLPPPDTDGVLEQILAGGVLDGFRYTEGGQPTETYDLDGRLTQLDFEDGETLYLFYTDGRLTNVDSTSGRGLIYGHDGTGRITSITNSAGQVVNYFYDANNNLIRVQYPSGAEKHYLYEDTRFPNALTGIIDELGNRIRTWGYDDNRRATLSTYGDAASTINRHTVAYNADVTSTLIEPSGNQVTYGIATEQGVAKFGSVSGHSASCGSNWAASSYDERGNRDQLTDHSGTVTDYDYNARNLIDQVIRGVGTPDATTTTYAWHPTLDQPVQIVTGNQREEYDYNSRGQVTRRALVDMTTGQRREWHTSYFEAPAAAELVGKVQSEDGPRTDVSDITTYDYYLSDDPGGNYLAGDLWKITNALGHFTEYLAYDGNGRPLHIRDANGQDTILSYHPRGWLASRTMAGRTTSHSYDAAGNLIRVTGPDGTYTEYVYDTAQRLIGVRDNLGNRIDYSLDAAGNRIAEQVRDPGGNLTRELDRVFDSVNRLSTLIDGNNEATVFGYDVDGNRRSRQDANLNTTTFEYDALGRLAATIDPLMGRTEQAYDDRGNLSEVTDPLGHTTRYTYDGLDDRIQTESPDAGIASFTFDAAGNQIGLSDARGVQVNYAHDALNRLVAMDFADDTLDVSFTYDAGANAVGRLTTMSDALGTVTYGYDSHGNPTSIHRAINGTAYTLAHTHDAGNRIMSSVYPSGMVIDYLRDASGRIVAIDQTIDGITKSLISNVSYAPFGPVTDFTYGNGTTFAAQFDLDYELDRLKSGDDLDWQYSHDPAGNLTAITDLANSTTSQSFGYDPLDRLANANGDYGSLAYSYDANGNRLQQNQDGILTDYNYEPTSNRLASTTDWTLTRDNAGNRIELTDISGTGHAYGYGDTNRLQTVSLQPGNQIIAEYQHDGLGQRLVKRVGGTETHFLYDAAGLLLGEYQADGTPIREYVYLNGQPVAVHATETLTPSVPTHIIDNGAPATSNTGSWSTNTNAQDYGGDYQWANGSGNTYRWTPNIPAGTYEIYAWWVDKKNHSAKVDYAIHHVGSVDVITRSHKASGGQWNLLGSFVFDGTGNEYIEISTSKGRLVADAIKLVQTDADLSPVLTQSNYYIHTDHLGTPRSVANASQQTVWRWRSDPFGSTLPENNPDGDANPLTLNLRFPGQYFDGETGLHYNYFRDYDPEVGRYVQSDPIGLEGGMNVFSYVSASPLRYKDPKGLKAYGQIQCDGSGGYEIVVFETGCVEGCVREHEQVHLEDYTREHPNACRGYERGQWPSRGNVAFDLLMQRSECKAWNITVSCLDELRECGSCPEAEQLYLESLGVRAIHCGI